MKKNLYTSDFKSLNRLIILSIAICLLTLFIINLIIIKKAMVYEAQIITNDLVLNSDFQFVILGDSNAESSLKGNYFKNYINISSGGDNYQDIFKKINFLINIRNLELKKIILQLPIHAFSDYRNINSKNIHFENLENPLNHFYISRLKKYWFNILQFKNLSPIGQKNKNGWYKNDTDFSMLSDEKIQSRSIKRAKQHKPVDKFKDTENYKALLNILNLAMRNDIQICAITLPKSHYYLKNLLKYPASREIILDYYNLSKNFDFTYFNLIGYLSDKKQISFFYDPDHLNVFGAEILTHNFKKIDC